MPLAKTVSRKTLWRPRAILHTDTHLTLSRKRRIAGGSANHLVGTAGGRRVVATFGQLNNLSVLFKTLLAAVVVVAVVHAVDRLLLYRQVAVAVGDAGFAFIVRHQFRRDAFSRFHRSGHFGVVRRLGGGVFGQRHLLQQRVGERDAIDPARSCSGRGPCAGTGG